MDSLNKNQNITKMIKVVIFFVVLVAIIALLYLKSPFATGFYPNCLFKVTTGFYCPGCGMTRAIYYLIHGHVLKAIRENILIVFLFFLILDKVYSFFTKKCKKRFYERKHMVMVLVLIVIVFWILRNVPIYPFTLLAPI